MASVSDTAGATRGQRALGSGIVLAGDRSARRTSALRHTRIVHSLKLLLPAGALLIAGAYAMVILGKGLGGSLPSLDIPKIVAENLAMDNPHYEGFNKDGGRYWVTAKKAMQDLKNLTNINLDTITGELIDANKERTKLIATRGTFNNKVNLLELYDSIDVASDNGTKVHLTRATVKTKEGLITSDEPVSVSMAAGTVTANQMSVNQKTKEYAFVTNVKTTLKARPPETTASTSSGGAQTFGNPNAPIDITSHRLDVNDAARVALFAGDVVAVQGASSLSSPELEVTYEGGSTPQDSKEQPDGKEKDAKPPQPSASTDAGKLKRVVAKNPVVLTEADGQKVMSRSADFDAAAQKAVLEGDVIMTQIPDRRAVGDRVEFDQSANTILLTGPVVVTQGANELKGRRLFFNRTTSKMNLTGSGGGNGRISARFTQAQAAAKSAPTAERPTRGVAFGGNFKTDPNAPVDVAADRLDVDDHSRNAVFTGDVRAQQAGFQLRAAELTANYTGSAGMGTPETKGNSADAAKLTRIQAKKNVEITSKDGQKATGDWADYDTRANTVTLGGDVIMTQNKNVVRGTKLVIDMTTGESVISTEAAPKADQPWLQTGENKTTGGRPSAVFYPNEIKDKAEKAGEAAKAGGWQSRSAPSP